jgi:hypothetical protein
VGCGESPGSGGEGRAVAPSAPAVSGLATYVATSGGRSVVVTGDLGDTSWRVHRVPGNPAPRDVRLAPSADGRVVAISVYREELESLHLLDILDGSLRRLPLPSDRVRTLPAVSRDGTRVALAGDAELFVVATDGGPPRRLPTLRPPTSPGTWLDSVWWSPDGQALLYELWQTDPDDPRPATTSVEFVRLDVDRLRSTALAQMTGPADGPAAWSPDSRRVAVVGDPWSTDAIRIVAARSGAGRDVIGVYPTDVVWTRRGIYTFAGDRAAIAAELVLVDPDAGTRRTVIRQEGVIVAPPSGDVVAVVAWPRLRVFSPTGVMVLDRTLRGAPDAPRVATGSAAVVLVDP